MTNKAVFVTGTGTDVGKTYVTSLIIKKLIQSGKSAAYYKAAMSGDKTDDYGNPVAADAEFVKEFTGIKQSVKSMCPFVYGNAYSPHLAAKVCGRRVDLGAVMSGYRALTSRYDYTVVEGSGGIVCPLRYDDCKILLEDVIKAMNIPCLIVADAGLGAINAVALTAEYIKTRGIKINGIIFNNYTDDIICRDNANMCESITGIKILAKVRRGDTDSAINREELF